ncbi:glutathione S-transferase family protein [Pasteurellaceae bacterium USgator11]|nr:glutathione S-transferase family protein [Pasteurellaceae bacterium USgator41]TNG96687.1 glutathione S-transferase family protein [Pasteurellaceae bacterium UScroc12]TNG99747.1 glutathione S-transferase family protein [Pasteurellaceae bacterium USgator11]TNH01327.1 glutathione S-transferase family protein [Pasteurellaceae bacterium UScroc31]
MLKLYTTPGTANCRSFSPFAYKAEALLALSEADYTLEYLTDFSNMPNGKVPVLQHGERLIADSELIKAYLAQHFALDIDRTLMPEQQSIGHAFRVMLEERTYWAGVYSRFIDPAGEHFLMNTMLGGAPEEMRAAIAAAMRENVRQEMHGHGIGRHSQAQIYAFAQADIEALLGYMGDNAFFFGNEPTGIDATIAGLFANWRVNSFDSALSDYLNTRPQIADYVQRFEQVVFGNN